MIRRLVIIAAWTALIAIAAATLSPLGMRPQVAGPGIERFAAFALVGLLFGTAYPRNIWLVVLLVVGTAVGLEVLQHLTPDRHGEVPDAIVKLAGGVFGVTLAVLARRMFGWSLPAT